MREPTIEALVAYAEARGVKLPQPATVARYGWSLDDWLRKLEEQGWRCPIRDHFVAQYVVDHEHVRGWKKMPPAERRKYVRGLVCPGCNYFVLSRHIDSSALAERVAQYLREYEARRP